ncbi:MAG: bifunctional ADP-heptose synthase, partial [Cyclobacteriaceae bacterium]|nr:bifunctional ADP-heptose synthase [Cyclobacteriaceae bacterium]
MRYGSIQEIFTSFERLRVLIIGDVMVDSYIHGTVTRISPEAPVPVLNVKSREKRLGGAANVALNIQALGAVPILCSVIGDDGEGDDFRALLERKGMSSEGILRSSKRRTTVKNRVISGGHHLIRIDEEEDSPLHETDRSALSSHILRLLEGCDVVIFEDYDKGCLDPEIIQFTIRKAKEKGIPTTVDPKKRNFLAYHHATLFKPNLKELREGMKLEVDLSEKAIETAVTELAELLHVDNTLITLSENGVFYKNKNEMGQHPAHVRSISDVSGAGDTVISIISLAIALDLPLSFSAELANLGGGIVCEYPGVVPIQRDRLLHEAKNNTILLT